MLKKALLAFAIAVLILFGVIAMQPAGYTVRRSIAIDAPPEVVFGYINDFHKWDGWSPWVNLDRSMKQSYDGPHEGMGAIYKWSGNTQAGEGAMLITDSRPNTHIGIDLSFTRPYVSNSAISFAVRPEREGSVVTWDMSGQNNLALKAVSLFYSMDKMIGPDFERGLTQLKALAESSKKK